jgi:hypothetical protein
LYYTDDFGIVKRENRNPLARMDSVASQTTAWRAIMGIEWFGRGEMHREMDAVSVIAGVIRRKSAGAKYTVW